MDLPGLPAGQDLIFPKWGPRAGKRRNAPDKSNRRPDGRRHVVPVAHQTNIIRTQDLWDRIP